MWDESESDKRARIHREDMDRAHRLQEEANELARHQTDLLAEHAYQAAEGAYRMQEAVDKLHETEELRLKEERQYRLEEQRAAVRRAGLPEFSESFRQEWLRLTRLLEQQRVEARHRADKAVEAERAIKKHKGALQLAEQRLHERVEEATSKGGPFGQRVVEVAEDLRRVPGFKNLLAARVELLTRGVLQHSEQRLENVAELCRDIGASRHARSNLHERTGDYSIVTAISAFFWLVGLLYTRVIFGVLSASNAGCAEYLGPLVVVFSIAAGLSLPLFLKSVHNARYRANLSSLHRWVVCCEIVLSRIGLKLAPFTPNAIDQKTLAGSIAVSLERIWNVSISHLTSRVIGSVEDIDANDVLGQQSKIEMIEEGMRKDLETWAAGEEERTMVMKRWAFLRDQLEQVGREIVAGHRLPGRQITLQDCPSCRGPITSESTICSHCARPISIAGSGQ